MGCCWYFKGSKEGLIWQKMFWTFYLSFDEDILAFSHLATVWATFSKIWVIISNLLVPHVFYSSSTCRVLVTLCITQVQPTGPNLAVLVSSQQHMTQLKKCFNYVWDSVLVDRYSFVQLGFNWVTDKKSSSILIY